MRSVTICSKVAALACCLSVTACAGDDPERPVTISSSALENPIAACQAQMDMCQRGPGPGGGCEQEMRACMEAYVAWMEAVRDGIAKCRADAGQCVASSTGNGNAASCREGYDQCIAALWRNPGSGNDEDAGVEDDAGAVSTAGAGGRAGYPGRRGQGGAGGRAGMTNGRGGFTPPGSNGGRGFPGAPGSSGSAGGGAAAGSGAPGLPGLPGLPPPGGFPGAGQGSTAAPPNPAACMQKLSQCMTSGGDLAKCAEEARECLRADPLAALFTR